MTIKIGDQVPNGVLYEYISVATEECPLGPNAFNVEELVKGKTIAIFAVPGAFTPTCSEQHLPGFIDAADDFSDIIASRIDRRCSQYNAFGFAIDVRL